MKVAQQIAKPVQVWLLVGVVMVFLQVVIGGVTRLTDSGLSITEWKPIMGVVPPLDEAEWQVAFEKYKVAARKQYEALHAGMSLGEFKVIFFWEYFHRLWARFIAVVFLLPFLWFLVRRQLPGWLVRGLGGVVALAMLEAVFGFIMVASGLNNDDRTWVSAYKLVIHLSIGTAVFAYLHWLWLRASQPNPLDAHLIALRKLGWWTVGVLLLQIAFGGLMAGMRAGLLHPHFPVFVEWGRLWQSLTAAPVSTEHLIDYEPNQSVKAIVQLLHRFTAWVVVILSVIFFAKIRMEKTASHQLKVASTFTCIVLVAQFLLGVFTVINCVGKVPVVLGALHQGCALVLLAIFLHTNRQFCKI